MNSSLLDRLRVLYEQNFIKLNSSLLDRLRVLYEQNFIKLNSSLLDRLRVLYEQNFIKLNSSLLDRLRVLYEQNFIKLNSSLLDRLRVLYEQNFIKLNSSLLDRLRVLYERITIFPDHFEFFKSPQFSRHSDTPNFQRGFKIFEDSDFIKERDGDNLEFRGIVERRFSPFFQEMGDFEEFRISGISLKKGTGII